MDIGRAASNGIESLADAISKFKVLEGAGNTIRKLNTSTEEVAKNIAGQKMAAVLTSLKATAGNDMSVGARTVKAGEVINPKTFDEAIDTLRSLGESVAGSSASEKEMMEAGREMVGKAYRDAIAKDISAAKRGGAPDKMIEKLQNQFNEIGDIADFGFQHYDEFGTVGIGDVIGSNKTTRKVGAAISSYFSDPENGKVRRRTAIAGYGLGAIGIRYLSGGNLTHNSKGERDIAGIPFI